MASLTHQRCFNHADREAVARCPDCRSFFCRECITEHEDQVICAACLRKKSLPRVSHKRKLVSALHLAQFVLGIVLAWFVFHALGDLLLAIPTSFHEGSLWNNSWFSSE